MGVVLNTFLNFHSYIWIWIVHSGVSNTHDFVWLHLNCCYKIDLFTFKFGLRSPRKLWRALEILLKEQHFHQTTRAGLKLYSEIRLCRPQIVYRSKRSRKPLWLALLYNHLTADRKSVLTMIRVSLLVVQWINRSDAACCWGTSWEWSFSLR